jgi:hypothetical protein
MSLVTVGPEALISAADDAVDATFLKRVTLAAMAIAQAVLIENPATTNHASRVNYARQVSGNPSTVTSNSIAWAVVCDMATGTGSNDQLILDRIAALWDSLSTGF